MTAPVTDSDIATLWYNVVYQSFWLEWLTANTLLTRRPTAADAQEWFDKALESTRVRFPGAILSDEAMQQRLRFITPGTTR